VTGDHPQFTTSRTLYLVVGADMCLGNHAFGLLLYDDGSSDVLRGVECLRECAPPRDVFVGGDGRRRDAEEGAVVDVDTIGEGAPPSQSLASIA
jgi:hypothetical protein